MHTVAARADRKLLPAAVAALLDRNDQTLRCPRAGLVPARGPNPRPRSRIRTHHRYRHQRRERERNRRAHRGYGLELNCLSEHFVTGPATLNVVAKQSTCLNQW